jgi:hypothetical protein
VLIECGFVALWLAYAGGGLVIYPGRWRAARVVAGTLLFALAVFLNDFGELELLLAPEPARAVPSAAPPRWST